MKPFVIFAAALFAIFLFDGCAHNEFATESSPTSTATVPGEKLDSSGGFSPGAGPGGASGNVRF
jgi:hypothetical protein